MRYVWWLLILALIACSKDKPKSPEVRKVPVTVTTAKVRDLEVWEPAVGWLEAVDQPVVAAEVGGKVAAILADVGDAVQAGQALAQIDSEDYRLAWELARADIARLEALHKAQRLQVERLRTLVTRQLANQAALDEAEAQLGALLGQLQAARVRLQQAERDRAKTSILSPVTGRVDERRVSQGDFITPASPLFRLTDLTRLRVRLPYPESLAAELRTGLVVELAAPFADQAVRATITEIRPQITPTNRAVQVIVTLSNPGGWVPGASVVGRVRVGRLEHAVMVPEMAVVVRPSGSVVYLVEGGIARQRQVKTGLRRDGWVEVLQGLDAGDLVAVDGAGWLTDGIPVEIRRR